MAEARQQRISFRELLRRPLERTLPRARKRGKGRDPLWDDIAVYEGPVPSDIDQS